MPREVKLNSKGQLLEQYHPAIYLDTCLLIEYSLGSFLKFFWSGDNINLSDLHYEIAELFKQDNRWGRSADLRTLFQNTNGVTGIVSSFALIEYLEKFVEVEFMNLASSLGFSSQLRGIGRKNIGELLYKLKKKRDDSLIGIDPSEDRQITPLEHAVSALFPDPGTLEDREFDCLYFANVNCLDLSVESVWTTYSTLSYLQVGAADIMHLRIAQHLGCDIFATIDKDFSRAKEVFGKELGLEVTVSMEQLMSAVNRLKTDCNK